MATLVLRAGKGSPLTNAEVDANFTNLNTEVAAAATTASWSGVTGKPATLAGYGITDAQPVDADLTAIAALAGTSGFLKKTAANTWALDTATYLTGINSSQVTTALGFTPYNATNPSGYITASASITGNAATATALQTARTINGVSFNGTTNITIADATKLPLTGGTLTGPLVVTSTGGSATDGLIVNSNGASGLHITPASGDTTQSGRLFFTTGTAGQGFSVRNSAGSLFIQSGATYGSSSGSTVALSLSQAGALNTAGAITQNGSQVLTAGNVSTYALPIGGGTLTGPLTLNNATKGNQLFTTSDVNNATLTIKGLNFTHAVFFNDSYNTGEYAKLSGGHLGQALLRLTGFSALNTISATSDYASNYASIAGTLSATGAITQAGNQVLHAGNYNSYSPTLTGTGASGSWGISVTGSAATLTTGRTIALTGDVTYTSGSFNGSANVTGTATLAASGVTAGTYTKVTVDAKGRVTVGALLASGDLPTYAGTLTSSQITTGLGFTPASLAGATFTGAIVVPGESRFYSGTYVDPDSGVSRAIKVGALGIAVLGGIKTDTLNSTGAITQNGSQVLHAGNYNTYAPALTGTGASGSWGISVTGSSASTTGNAATATALQTARTIGGVSFNGTANINLPGVNAAGNQNTTGTAAGLTDNSAWMLNRGSVAAASVDTATLNGFYTQNNVGDSQGLLVFNAGGSLGPLQMTFTYGGLMQFRGKTDSTTWTPWKTVVTSANVSSYALPIGGGTLTGAYLDFSNSSPSLRITSGPGTFFIGDDDIVNLGSGAVVATPSSRIASGVAILSTHAYATGQGDNKTHFGYYNGTSYLNYIRGAGTYFDSATLQIAGNQALHAGNYNSYSPTLTGTGASGSWGIAITGTAANASQLGGISSNRAILKRRGRIHSDDSTSLNSSITAPEMGFTYGGSGEPAGPFIAFGGLSGDIDYSMQLAGAYAGSGNNFKIRTYNGDSAAWNAWRTIITDGNYTSYAPSLTGSGASGSWGISVTGSSASTTGNAATATTWQTARTLTIGSTGKSVNGSANVAWSHEELGAVKWVRQGTLDVNAANPTGVYEGSTGSWTNRGPSTNNAGALININTHPGNYFSQLWFDTGGNGIYHRTGNGVLPTAAWERIVTNSGTWGINITGNAATVTNGLVSTGSYADPAWITSLASSKLTGTIDNARLNGGTYTINVSGSSGSTTGNAASATRLINLRTINGVGFDGTANITVADSTKLPLSGGTLTGALYGNGGVYSNGIIEAQGQLRASGWWGTSSGAYSGLAVEVGVSGGVGVILTYNRNTGTWGTLNLQGTSSNLQIGTAVNVSSGALQQGGNQVLHAGNYTSYSPSLTGTGASGSWGISVTGSAATLTTACTLWGQSFNGSANVIGALSSVTTLAMSGQLTNTVAVGTAPFVITSTTRVANLNVATAGTADTLTTARTINGTSFNGSANITTANWGTARTLTLGATGKSVDGSANVAWTFSEIAAGQTITTSGSTASLILSDTGASGANLRLIGNGATTPNKTIRAQNGAFQIINSAYTAPSLTLTDGGELTTPGNHIINNASPTVYFQDTDGNSAMLHCNSNLMYILRGANNTISWTQVGGYWPVYWDLTNNNATFGGAIWAAGNITAYSDERVKENWEGLVADFVERLAEVKSGTFDRTDIKKRQAGVSAQSMQKLLPEVVDYHEKEKLLSVAYGNAALVSAVELAKDNLKLRARIERLEALVEKLIGD